jgi:CRP/FNR family nitrogen fixation transcriptional regulator
MLVQTVNYHGAMRYPDILAARRLHALRGFGVGGLDRSMRSIGMIRSYRNGAQVFRQGEAAACYYKVIRGTVMTHRALCDGRRHIGGFYFVGEFLGLDSADEHSLSAETKSDVDLLVTPRSALSAMATRDPSVAQHLFALAARELRRAQDHALLLQKSAKERVAYFLLNMAERLPGANAMELFMTRQEIADYLGLTIETVSRTLTALESCGAIEIPKTRSIILRDPSALRHLDS